MQTDVTKFAAEAGRGGDKLHLAPTRTTDRLRYLFVIDNSIAANSNDHAILIPLWNEDFGSKRKDGVRSRRPSVKHQACKQDLKVKNLK